MKEPTPKLFVALPTTHGVMQAQFLPGLLDLFRERKIDMTVYQYVDPYGVLARNSSACDFMESDCTHFLTIDADVIFTANHVKMLLENDVDVVGGLYPKKAEGQIQWVCNALPDRPVADERGLLPLMHIGTGFLMVKRAVMQKMLDTYRDEMSYLEAEINTQKWDFFPMRIIDNRMISEDWFFCNRCRELGYTVYGDTKVILSHLGTVRFPLKTQVIESRRERQDSGLAVA
jgi:hypothetical protein